MRSPFTKVFHPPISKVSTVSIGTALAGFALCILGSASSTAAETLTSSGILTAEAPPGRGCATLLITQLMNRNAPLGSGGTTSGPGFSASVAANKLAGRTYLTTHFALQYTLAPSVHRARIVSDNAGDVVLKSTVDSLLGTIPSTTTYKRDSTLHARLDSLGAGTPLYIMMAAQYFERAWQYYDSIGMRMPAYTSTSDVYDRPSQGRYVVDIADANIAGGFSGPYYGLSFPPGQGGRILFENDFLYGVTYNPLTDVISGSPVRAVLPGNVVYRDYSAADWEKGVQVTASHEFYHSVQYAYDSTLNNIHAWYELSATGMEERLAPSVNDYFQYLRFNIPKSHQISLMTAQTVENYGNAIFHIFLTHALGAAFDRAIWEALATTNDLPTALIHGVGTQARWDSLYTAYAAAMTLSGSSAAANSPLAFSPDMPQWPKPRLDTLPASGITQLDFPALTFRILRPPVTDTGLVTLIGIPGSRRIDSSFSGYQSTLLTGGAVLLTHPPAGTATSLATANTSFTQIRHVALSKGVAETYAVRNPVTRAQTPLVFLAPKGGLNDSLKIVAESGRRVATIAADSSHSFWSWNLKDPQNRTVPPGFYFFKTSGAGVKSLIVLP